MVHFSVSVGLWSPLSPFTKVGNVRSSSAGLSEFSEFSGVSVLSGVLSLTTRQPGSRISLPVTLNSTASEAPPLAPSTVCCDSVATSPESLLTSPNTVVVENLQSGRKTPINRLATRSNTFCSASLSPCGITPVGMMAWWSVTFDESNTRFDFFSALPPMGLMSSTYGATP